MNPRSTIHDLLRGIESNGIETLVAKTFTFYKARGAYAYVSVARHVGKVMIALR